MMMMELPPHVPHLVYERIFQQAESEPAALALQSLNDEMTYRDLRACSTSFASYLELRRKSSRPEIVVVITNKSIWAVVVLVALLASSRAFLFLEPSLPLHRVAKIASDAGCTLAIISDDIADRYTQIFPAVELLPTRKTVTKMLESANSYAKPSEEDVAYVVYTSGSTGEPQGILVEHKQLSWMCYYAGQTLRLTNEVRMFQFSSWAFDAYIFEIIATLVHGGCACIPSESDRLNRTVQSMEELAVTHALFTPSFLGGINLESTSTLRTLIIAGEKAPKDIVQTMAQKMDVFLAYGPAECCVISSWLYVNGQKFTEGSIGKPAGCIFWITDLLDNEVLSPMNTMGELVIEGHIVARGYVRDNSPPFGERFRKAGRRIDAKVLHCRSYRTGDLVRHQSNGEIIFVGRKDTQFKLRGQRIDLSEIDQILRDVLPSHLIPVVDVVGTINGGQQLVSFFVSNCPSTDCPELQMREATPEAMRELKDVQGNLRRSLPDYMIPSSFCILSRLPLGPTGKLDRRALRQLYLQYTSGKQDPSLPLELPSTQMEASLKSLWCSVLCQASGKIGRNSHFFNCTGDSIAAIRLASKARNEGLCIKVEQIMKNPILKDMAIFLQPLDSVPRAYEQNMSSLHRDPVLIQAAAVACMLEDESVESIYSCTPAQEFYIDISKHYKGMMDKRAYLAEQFVLRLSPMCDIERLKAAWSAIAAVNTSLRTRIIQHRSSGLLQVVHRVKGQLQWSHRSNLSQYLEDDKAKDFDFGDALYRLAIIEHDDGNRFFVWTAHHCIYDGWSFQLLLNELGEVYRGRNPKNRPNMSSFVTAIKSIDQAAAKVFWKNHLNNIQCVPFFPKKFHRSFHMSKEKSRQMQCPPLKTAHVTLATMIHATWALIIAKYTSAPDVVFHVSRSGRDFPMPNVHDILGPTVSRHPLRIRLCGNKTISWLLSEIQNDLSDMTLHQFYNWQNMRSFGNAEADIEKATRNAILLGVHPLIQRSAHTFTDDIFTVDSIHRFQTHPVPLLLESKISNDGIKVNIAYDPEVYQDYGIDRLLDDFCSTLDRVVITEADRGVTIREFQGRIVPGEVYV